MRHNTYRQEFLQGQNRTKENLRLCIELAKQTRAKIIYRTNNIKSVYEIIDIIMNEDTCGTYKNQSKKVTYALA